MVLLGLAAPSAFASDNPTLLAVNCQDIEGVYHLMTNINQNIGIDFQGTGNLTKVTTTPGDSHIQCTGVSDYLEIFNNSGNCIRMRDASNNYTVIEEVNCEPSNPNYEFQAFTDGKGHYEFLNEGFTGRFLAVSCTGNSGSQVFGVLDQTGTCINWVTVIRMD
jgi:hypothetical protein